MRSNKAHTLRMLRLCVVGWDLERCIKEYVAHAREETFTTQSSYHIHRATVVDARVLIGRRLDV